MGKVLNVDLTSGTIEEEDLDYDLAAAFLGGYGLGAKYLFDRMPAGTDSFSEDSLLGFFSGPTTGTPCLFSGRWMVVSKSPQTGTWNDANSGGYFGPEMKRAGFDAIIFRGISKSPVYLWINDGKAELRSARKYWGMDTNECFDAFKADLDPKCQAAIIGPGGEKMSLMGNIIDDYHRAAGRGGSGAVMGSKKLKAIVARGTLKPPVHDMDKLRAWNKKVVEGLKTGPLVGAADLYSAHGTAFGTDGNVQGSDCPVNNWGDGLTEYVEKSGEKLTMLATANMDKYKVGKYNCSSCPLGCGAHYEIKEGRWPMKTPRPEYETIGVFGPLCSHSEVDAICKCNDICNRAGIDTISAGGTIAWAMECYSNGVLTKKDTGGIDLRWGDSDAVVQAMEEMARGRTKFGKLLAMGSAAAADSIGKGHEYVQTVGGIEIAVHDPRLCPGYARTAVLDPTPGRHVKGGLGFFQGGMGPEDKYDWEKDNGAWDLTATSQYEIWGAAGMCYFIILCGLDWNEFLPALINAVTGIPEDDIRKAGYRVFAMRHMFNIREGFTRGKIRMPDRIGGRPPLKEGVTADITLKEDILIDNFLRAAGYDIKTARPYKKTIRELGYMDNALRYCKKDPPAASAGAARQA
jgi:aldehyde:ferredoxin oxidoreductase